MVPENTKIKRSSHHEREWDKIYVVTTGRAPIAGITGRIIANSLVNPNAIWPKILGLILECEKKPFTGSLWHSARLHDERSLADLPGTFVTWATRQKILSHTSIRSTLKSLEQLSKQVGAVNVEFEIAMDHSSLQLTLRSDKQDEKARFAFSDFSANPYAQLAYVRNENNTLITWIKIDLGSSSTPKICLLSQFDSSDETDTLTNQEAS